MTRRLGVIGLLSVVGLSALGAHLFLPRTPAPKSALAFTIPMPVHDQTSQNAGRCFPQRNIGIAESAEHYYASCGDVSEDTISTGND